MPQSAAPSALSRPRNQCSYFAAEHQEWLRLMAKRSRQSTATASSLISLSRTLDCAPWRRERDVLKARIMARSGVAFEVGAAFRAGRRRSRCIVDGLSSTRRRRRCHPHQVVQERRRLTAAAPVTSLDGDVERRAQHNDSEAEHFESFTVSASESTLRVDKVLATRFSAQSRTYFAALIDSGAVSVDGSSLTKKSAKLPAGSAVDVSFVEPADRSVIKPQDIALDVLYEDEHLLAINKAPDLVVHPAPGNWEGTLVNALAYHLGRSFVEDVDREHGSVRPGIVHRLDKGTSGVIVAAKSSFAQWRLQEQFQQRTVHKSYLAVTARNPMQRSQLSLRCTKPIGRHPNDRTRMAALPEERGGRPSTTTFHFVASDASDRCTLLRATLETGRTHQIRVHLRDVMAPIVGDTVYGHSGDNERYKSLAQRPLLHAYELCLTHPVSGRALHFQAPIPEDMLHFIRRVISPDLSSINRQLHNDTSEQGQLNLET